ncbi:hypothetical protein MJA45_17590 [Paenibacillus aurantius]|uniref:DUF4177 domain-containing protein n=1 Tax=Paenibacillus aurantius TaxID=2918900 RepID=A0AA96LCX6_9BACL|nr:hypothetical protein [Paenibacillus aurantius]WNQ09437.1 hypothetical protein MJA45_17590 [Paenibacillus aurantius]
MVKVRWEYYVGTSREELPEKGTEGWELTAVTMVEGKECFYFKRPCPSIREELTLSQRRRALEAGGGSSL